MDKVQAFLWFDTRAAEAAEFYVGLFPDSGIVRTTRYGPAGPGPEGSVMTVQFRLAGRDFVALNGGPHFRFTEAISFSIDCSDQSEVDRYWSALTAGGGEEGPCGWCKDRFGLSWQVNPTRLGELLADPDPGRAKRAMEAMLKMKKIDVAALERAADR